MFLFFIWYFLLLYKFLSYYALVGGVTVVNGVIVNSAPEIGDDYTHYGNDSSEVYVTT